MTIPPIHREVVVDAEPAAAFEVFTAGIGRWWPLASHSVHGADASVSFTDGTIVERSADGAEAIWGTVTRWDPPEAVAFSWHPGRPPDKASAVEVRFRALGDGTLVVLEHTGWESHADPEAARAEYDEGWPVVLDRYRGQVAAGIAL